MVKKNKLKSFADEIARLERNVTRRQKQLEKMGVEIDRPKHIEPKTIKQAREVIFKLESILRHTSTNPSERKGAARGQKIKKEKAEAKQMDRDYRTAKKVMKKASDYFMKELANPINEKREAKGLPKRSFRDELNDFILGMNPKDIKDKRYQKESAIRMKELALKYKNNPKEAHKDIAIAGVTTLRLNILHSLRNITSNSDYDKISKYFQAMSDQDLLDHYKGNLGLYNRIMDDSETGLTDYDMDEYLSEVKDALDITWEDAG